ncbi:phage baseplate assembly protein [Magnetospirillum fulvum]|uniref:Phage baseplate assembly protein V n=1 Tax=Magnetospirillum fulvum MGU-K5 TaxID=1316936 RepID=S9S9J7_MAGFU|nr:phage baseplate assembly protein [Magnetospirillum fulvum]EPY01374.1 phage baseplate assembly protein V [Magnetospirillum fulvum MGU-K5]
MDLSRLTRRVGNMLIAAAVVRDAIVGGCHRGQLSGRAGEGKGGIRILTPFGLAVRIVPGEDAETVLLAVEPNLRYALPPHDPRYQPDDLQPGESCLYNADDPDGGCRIHLKRGGVIAITCKDAIVKADNIARLEGGQVEIHAKSRLAMDCGGNGVVWTPDTRTDYVTGSTGTAKPIHPPEVPKDG